MSVENLVEWMVLWKTFVDDVEEISTKVSFDFKKGGLCLVMFLLSSVCRS